MEFLRTNILTLLIFLPTIGALLVLLTHNRSVTRWIALGTTLATFVLSMVVLALYNWNVGGTPGYAYGADGASGVVQLVQRANWIPSFNVQYLVGVDGLSLPMILLSTIVCVLACAASWDVDRLPRGYFALFLFLETGILGVFCSLDLFLFYVFFELSLLPMYFLIGIWGGPRKEYAAIKFFLFTLLGSIALLIVLIGTYLHTRDFIPNGTFDLVRLASGEVQQHLRDMPTWTAVGPAFFVLAMFCFLVKVPAVPLHTWLPDAHVEAPTPISMVLAAVLLKFGGYGILRVAYPLFPDAARQLWMPFAIIGVVSIIYGGLCALAQTDFKRLVAYSSVGHMGFVTLGAAVLTPAGLNGAVFTMVAHGVVSAMLFFVVGVIYDRTNHRELSRFGGLAATMPVYTGLATVGMFANLGLPGLCSFVGELLVLLGTFQAARPDSVVVRLAEAPAAGVWVMAIMASGGIVLAAAYMLWAVQRLFLGPARTEYAELPDLSNRELSVLTPLAVLAVVLGIFPGVLFFTFTNQTLSALFGLFT